MRLRYDKNAEPKLQASPYMIKENQYPIKLDENCIIEIGMGKGEMIVELARLNPTKTFYGLEKYPTVAAKALKKAEEYQLNNFYIIIADAVNIPDIFVGKASTIWLTFSDPWPKARHFRRRLTYKSFLDLYKIIMDENSILKFKSDNDKLYEFSLESFNENDWKIIDFGEDLHQSSYASKNVMTGYERKWSEQGKNINFIFAKP
ncbi:tRNA (guanosine(46)-N7)-methyltransferase TrmB [Mycoplasma miroungigenitalium]|uniref:tRNA (guanine-N(7)-)-methyltransferase n=1 Tax=Mycoplasma miroungigenitalium TaxID=754515 RepID=A0A6M4JC77_9MOLU|nr:tRNA (guanosine(46)-N7)-methyltransferase TrmB [Mycoplasma miroungigenitalium]QJR43679.1 tRNA (guanosine(46)-N7)-methyltransferase TrmB [Mycoplasma miroungigenitalium]